MGNIKKAQFELAKTEFLQELENYKTKSLNVHINIMDTIKEKSKYEKRFLYVKSYMIDDEKTFGKNGFYDDYENIIMDLETLTNQLNMIFHKLDEFNKNYAYEF